MNNEQIEKLPRVTLLYLGVTETSKGKKTHRWAVITGVENDGQRIDINEVPIRFYGKRGGANIVRATPGAIFTFPDKGGGTIFSGWGEYTGHWQNTEQVIRWQAVSDAIEAEIATLAKAARDMRQRLDKQALQPFRLAYRDLGPAGRRQLIAYVVGEITRWQ